LCPR